MFLLFAHHFHTVRSAAQTPISRKGIFRVLPIFRTHFSHVISQITFRTFAFRISQITHSRPWWGLRVLPQNLRDNIRK